jgi:serine protease Do
MSPLGALSDALVELVARTTPGVVGVEHGKGQGSGIVLAQDGLVLTNAHVVAGASGLRITMANGVSADARVVGADPATDIALVKADASDLTRLAMADSRAARVGQLVVAIGNPLRFERSVSLGVVSAVERSLPAGRRSRHLEGLLQTDAAINPGNSGGPLLDAEGHVLGVNTAIVPFAQGIGFAVPAHTATWVAAVLLQKGEVRRPRIGIHARTVDVEPTIAAAAGLARARGVRVFQVQADSPAQRAGLRDGDVLLEVDGDVVRSIDDLQRALVYAGTLPVRVGVLRGRGRHEVEVRADAAA